LSAVVSLSVAIAMKKFFPDFKHAKL
jgi:hypothetical protein